MDLKVIGTNILFKTFAKKSIKIKQQIFLNICFACYFGTLGAKTKIFDCWNYEASIRESFS